MLSPSCHTLENSIVAMLLLQCGVFAGLRVIIWSPRPYPTTHYNLCLLDARLPCPNGPEPTSSLCNAFLTSTPLRVDLAAVCLSPPLDVFFALSRETALYKIATAPPPPSPAFPILLVCLSFPKLLLPLNLPYNVPVLLYY